MQADEAAQRWPVAWLILRPAKYGLLHQLPTEVRTVCGGGKCGPLVDSQTAATCAKHLEYKWLPA